MSLLWAKLLAAYLLGSISGSLLVGCVHGVDIRELGSGNAGGTNAFRTQGWRFAVVVVAIDMAKGALAALIGYLPGGMPTSSMSQALASARPGGSVGFVGVPHGVTLDGQQLFFAQKNLLGGPAPVRRFLPDLIDLVMTRKIDPGRVFDLELPLRDVAEGYRAMDERRAIKTLLRLS